MRKLWGLFPAILLTASLLYAQETTKLSVVSDSLGSPGDTVATSIALQNPVEVAGVQVKLTFPSWLSPVGEPSLTDRSIEYAQGYRIQIFASPNKEEAVKVEEEARDIFSEGVYLEFEAPYYKVRVGDCQTVVDAERLLKKIRTMGYSDAFRVRTTIFSEMQLSSAISDNKLILVIYSPSGAIIPPGEGSIVKFHFKVSSDAPVGASSKIHIEEAMLSDPKANPIPVEASDGSFTVIGGKAELSLPDTTASPGSHVKIPVFLSNQMDVAGVQIELTYDPSILTASEVEPTERSSDFTLSSTISSGNIKVLLYSAEGKKISSGEGAILKISFAVSSDAAPGESSSLSLTKVILSDPSANPIPFTKRDGRITVVQGAREPPVVTSISPASGFTSGGTSVMITGSNFASTQGTGSVTFGGTAATSYTSWSDTEIVCVTPAHTAGTTDVAVTADNGLSGIKSDGFLYIKEGFSIAANVKVTNTAGVGLRIHKDDPTGETVKVVPDGWVFKITGDPQYNIGEHNWWEIQEEKYEPSSIKGWVAEDFLEEVSSGDLIPSLPPDYFVSDQKRIEDAIQWAKEQEGSSDWNELCLRFVSQAYGLGENVNTETTAWTWPNDAIEKLRDKFYATSDCWNPPTGALVFFSATGDYEPYGHIGIYLGDGEIVHAYGTVRIQSLTGSGGIEQLELIGFCLGWAYPPEEWFLQKNQPPVASFTYSPESPTTNRQITFDASSSYDPDGQVVSYQWDFGDGFTASGPKISHSYNRVATYTLTLIVTDDKGATDSESLGIPISLYPSEAISVSSSGPPTLEFANLDDPAKRIELYKAIKQVLNVERAKAKQQGKDEDHLFNCMDVLLKQLDPDQQDRNLRTKDMIRDGALSEAQELFVSVAGEIAGAGIYVLTGMPAPFLGEGMKLLAFEIAEKLVLRDIRYATVKYPKIGRMEIVFRPSEDKILVNAYLEDPINQNLFMIIPIEYKPLRTSWGTYVCSPMWCGITCPPEAAVKELYPKIEHVKIIGLYSPAELRVYDSQGRVTGLVQGNTKIEIPNSCYYDDTVVIFDPFESYRYEVVSTGEGKYGLTVASVKEEETTTFAANDIPTSSTAVHQYAIDWHALSEGEKGVTLQIDSDGDGTFEQIVATDNTLTPLETTPSTGGTLENTYAYPNPFNPDREPATFRFSLSKSANVTVKLYDAGGRLVTTLTEDVYMEAEVEQGLPWDGKNDKGDIVANGVYFYVIESSSGEKGVGKVAVLR